MSFNFADSLVIVAGLKPQPKFRFICFRVSIKSCTETFLRSLKGCENRARGEAPGRGGRRLPTSSDPRALPWAAFWPRDAAWRCGPSGCPEDFLQMALWLRFRIVPAAAGGEIYFSHGAVLLF